MVFPGYPQETQGLVNYYYVYVYINYKNPKTLASETATPLENLRSGVIRIVLIR
jgi:hypothetical protein